MTTRTYEYGVLLSHAAETTIPGLVIEVSPPTLEAATDVGTTGANATGTKYRLVRREPVESGPEYPWRTPKDDLSPAEAIAKGKADGWKGWKP